MRAFERNIQLRRRTAAYLAEAHWITGLGGSLTPEELKRLGTLDQISGTLAAPEWPVCLPGGSEAETEELRGVAAARTWLGLATIPRCLAEQ